MPDETQNDDRVMSLVDLTLSQPPGQRELHLRNACENDRQLFEQVWQYVQTAEQVRGFHPEPPFTLRLSDQHLEPNQILNGRFRIVREIAQGGMGVVYEAWDKKVNKRVAVKCAKPGFRQCLSPEVRHAQEITHPNVCKIFEIHTITLEGEEVDFLTMEFLDGPTLAQRLYSGPLSHKEARTIAFEICAGLAEAHRQQVIHGDLKSSNVILARGVRGDSRAVITDFGLARQLESFRPTAPSGVGGGTPDYMAPELWRGEKATTASDVYALGVLLFEMVSGRRPYGPGVSIEERQSRKPPSVSGKWDRIVARCLDPDPARRMVSAVQVAEALEQPSRRMILAAVAASGATAATVWIYRRADTTSVAVIPFSNAQITPETKYLSDGISEGLINSLSQLPGLKVIARSSSFRFASEGIDIRRVARTLNVHTLVTGRVDQRNGRLRITTELVREDGTAVWGAEYNPSLADLTYVQAQISAEIAQRLQSQLTRAERHKVAKITRVDPGAFALFLRGRFQMQLYSPESTQKAASYFEQALAVDPSFALANAALANSYRRLGGAGILKPAEALALAEKAALRALAADKDMALAHAVLADIKKDQWDWAGAEHEYHRALALSPSLASARVGLAICLSVIGKYDEAVPEILRARELDPVALPGAIDTAAVFYNVRRYDRALEILKESLRLDPSAPAVWTWMGIVNGGQGKFVQALAAFDKAIQMGDKTPATLCYYVFALARTGKVDQALRLLDKLQRSGDFIPPSSLAVAYTGLNQKDRAMESLEAGYLSRDPLLQYITVESHLDELYHDVRFQTLVAKMGLPPLAVVLQSRVPKETR